MQQKTKLSMSLKNWVHNWDKTDSYFFGAIVGLLMGLAYYFFGTDYTDFIITCVVIILSWWSYSAWYKHTGVESFMR